MLIPSRTTAKHPRKTDWHIYKERHLVENLFLKLKNNRQLLLLGLLCSVRFPRGIPFFSPTGMLVNLDCGAVQHKCCFIHQILKTDWHIYKERHLVENLFLKLKNNRRFATRYEKKALYFYAVVYIACTGTQRKRPSPVPLF